MAVDKAQADIVFARMSKVQNPQRSLVNTLLQSLESLASVGVSESLSLMICEVTPKVVHSSDFVDMSALFVC